MKPKERDGGKKIPQKTPMAHSYLEEDKDSTTTRVTRSRQQSKNTRRASPSSSNWPCPPDMRGDSTRSIKTSQLTNRLYAPPIPLERMSKERREEEARKILLSLER